MHKTFGVSPGAIAFHCDMFLPIPIITDIKLLRSRRQSVIDKDSLKENKRRKHHDYNIGDQIMIFNHKTDALGAKSIGPFTITQVHTNGTVSFLRNEHIIERINLRRIKPYHSA